MNDIDKMKISTLVLDISNSSIAISFEDGAQDVKLSSEDSKSLLTYIDHKGIFRDILKPLVADEVNREECSECHQGGGRKMWNSFRPSRPLTCEECYSKKDAHVVEILISNTDIGVARR